MGFKWMLFWKGYEIPTITLILFIIAAFWTSGMFIAPLSVPQDSVVDLSGKVGSVENNDTFEDMNSYAWFFYWAGDANCHTKIERSYFINGNQMPFCARDVGIFLGMAFGLYIALFKRFELKLWWLIGGLVPMGVDWLLNSFWGVYHNNISRVLTGGLAGIVITFALGFVLWDVSKTQAMRRELMAVGKVDREPEGEEIEEGLEEVEDKGTGEEKGKDTEDDTREYADKDQDSYEEEEVVEEKES